MKSNKSEPTLRDVLEVVQIGFDRVDSRMTQEFDEVHKRLERNEAINRSLRAGIDNLTERENDTNRRVINLEHRTEDIRDTLDSMESAVDKDSTSILGHEQRITRLEKSRT